MAVTISRRSSYCPNFATAPAFQGRMGAVERSGGSVADVRSSLQQFSSRCIVQRMLTIASRLDVMNRLGRAMADPARSRILLTLLGGPAYPAALARELELTRSNVSNHLTCLRDCGIVVAEPQGRKTRYEIIDAHLVQALNSLLDTTLAADENAPCIDSACDVPGCATGEGNR